jgi:flagellar assembly protein FliH
VAVRVPPEDCAAWKTYFATHLKGVAIEVHEDASLAEDQCLLETELGIADVSIDAQLKEIEQGLFDLLAQRPDTR